MTAIYCLQRLEQRPSSDPKPLLTLPIGCQMRVLTTLGRLFQSKRHVDLSPFLHVGHTKLGTCRPRWENVARCTALRPPALAKFHRVSLVLGWSSAGEWVYLSITLPVCVCTSGVRPGPWYSPYVPCVRLWVSGSLCVRTCGSLSVRVRGGGQAPGRFRMLRACICA